MRRLTIGSLKYDNRIENSVAIDRIPFEEIKGLYNRNKLVEIEQNQQLFQLEVESGQSLLDVALKKNIPIQYKCKKGTCGKCKVKVLKGKLNLTGINQLEEKKLKQDIKGGFRLACQAIAK